MVLKEELSEKNNLLSYYNLQACTYMQSLMYTHVVNLYKEQCCVQPETVTACRG